MWWLFFSLILAFVCAPVLLGLRNVSTPVKKSHAVIIGGSVAGLLVAAFLSTLFEKVTILEKDEEVLFSPRGGVPQHEQNHNPLFPLQRILNFIFPGLLDEMQDRNECEYVNWTEQFYVDAPAPACLTSEKLPPLRIFQCDRIVLESRIRERVKKIKNVIIQYGIKCDAVTVEDGEIKSIHCKLRRRGSLPTKQSESSYAADLFVDCSGKMSATLSLIEEKVTGPVPEHYIKNGLQYVSFTGKRNDSLQHNVKMAIAFANAGSYALVFTPTSRSLTSATMMAYANSPFPTDWESLKPFIHSTFGHNQNVLQIADHIDMVEKPKRFVIGFCRRRFPTLCKRWPTNYVALGDVVCSLDPQRAEGMSCAAMQAECLYQTLIKQSTAADWSSITKSYNAAVNAMIDRFWMATIRQNWKSEHRFIHFDSCKQQLHKAIHSANVYSTKWVCSVFMRKIFRRLTPTEKAKFMLHMFHDQNHIQTLGLLDYGRYALTLLWSQRSSF